MILFFYYLVCFVVFFSVLCLLWFWWGFLCGIVFYVVVLWFSFFENKEGGCSCFFVPFCVFLCWVFVLCLWFLCVCVCGGGGGVVAQKRILFLHNIMCNSAHMYMESISENKNAAAARGWGGKSLLSIWISQYILSEIWMISRIWDLN